MTRFSPFKKDRYQDFRNLLFREADNGPVFRKALAEYLTRLNIFYHIMQMIRLDTHEFKVCEFIIKNLEGQLPELTVLDLSRFDFALDGVGVPAAPAAAAGSGDDDAVARRGDAATPSGSEDGDDEAAGGLSAFAFFQVEHRAAAESPPPAAVADVEAAAEWGSRTSSFS